MYAARVNDRMPRLDWCCTCDKPLSQAMEPEEDIGPHHHGSAYPDHYIISVTGELYVWKPSSEEELVEEPHPYMKIRTGITPDPAGERKITLPSFTGYTTIRDIPQGDLRDRRTISCAKVYNEDPHAPHDWRAQQEGRAEYVDAFCLGYHPLWEEEK